MTVLSVRRHSSSTHPLAHRSPPFPPNGHVFPDGRRDLERLVESQHRAVSDGQKQRLERCPEAAELVGHLLPLQCGHNTNFSELERERFLYHLSSQGWAIDQFDDL